MKILRAFIVSESHVELTLTTCKNDPKQDDREKRTFNAFLLWTRKRQGT